MKHAPTSIVIVLVLIAATVQAQQARIVVTNPSLTARMNEPVVVSWSEVQRVFPTAQAAAIALMDEQGSQLPVQVDDLDFDGTPEELTFVASFAPRQERRFTIAPGGNEPKAKPGARTDAQNWKRINGVLQSVDDDDVSGNGRDRKAYRFDGVGWESEVVGYRLYLDGRNAVDIQGKRKPGLYWKWIGESGVDYQLDADWGMDVLHVGPALGVGGIGFWVGDSVLKPLTLDRQRTRIVARGPVRAIVQVEYSGWDLGEDKVEVSSLFSIYAGDRASEHRITMVKGRSPKTIVTGIVKHDSTEVFWDPDRAQLYTVGHQSRANDTLMMALIIPSNSVVRKTEDAYSHLVLMNLEENVPLRILISSYWQGETRRVWDSSAIDKFLKSTSLRLNEPLTVTLR